jgi:tRNA pseudouridine32 synthase/23S rRNA pseudouridine746 synthase
MDDLSSDITQKPDCLLSAEICYQDESLIVVNKPSGTLAVPGRGKDKQDCLSTQLQQRFPNALVVHRLDRDTSGLMIFALTKEAQRLLGIAFSQREVIKHYQAVVEGRLDCEYGEIAIPIMKDWPNRPRQKVDYQQGKPSITCFQCLYYDELRNRSYVKLVPITGRTHQIRLHLQTINHGIIGDPLYNPTSLPSTQRLLLHASYISFQHPVLNKTLEFSLDAEFFKLPKQ